MFKRLPLLAILLVGAAATAQISACDGDPPVTTNPPITVVTEDAGPDVPAERCDIPLDRFVGTGQGARIRMMAGTSDGIGGPAAYGKAGDYLLENDKIRLVIQGPDRHIGPQPYGGTILDADLVRPPGEPGRDQFGEIGLLYNFGRTVDPTFFEILADGSGGGPVILAASGRDTDNDYLSIKNQLRNQLGSLPVVDPYGALPMKITNYFILNPGENRLRYVSAFCNEGVSGDVHLATGDLTDPGYTVELFNGTACTGGFGFGGVCTGLDRMSWYGYQGVGVAYGYAPYKPNANGQPEAANAILTISGVTGSILGSSGVTGLLSWFDPDAGVRNGELVIPPRQSRSIARDFVVGRDLGEVSTSIYKTRAQLTGTQVAGVQGVVTVGGSPLRDARVAWVRAGEVVGVYVTDSAGAYQGSLPPGSYTASAWAPGHRPSTVASHQLIGGNQVTSSFTLTAPRRLTVNIRELPTDGGTTLTPSPGKVTVLCAGGPCADPAEEQNRFTDMVRDQLLNGIRHIELVGPSGTSTFELPPGQYDLVVTRGPEYSIFPNTFPTAAGHRVDLTTSDRTVDAEIARVVDTSGFVAADFHVHAVSSPDSPIENHVRILNFLAEGMDVIVSTDHDFVTDYAPVIQGMGAENLLASVVGQEVSAMDFGHYNLFPMTRDPADPITGGAVDWAGGRGPTLTVAQVFQQARAKGVRTIHFNHPRGFLGGFTHLRVDTDTLATRADPKDFRMATPALALPSNTRILSSDFNAIEVLNSGEDDFHFPNMVGRFNDWFTLLSRGLRVTATGVSDTHRKNARNGGYWRTYVEAGSEGPSGFSDVALSEALNAQRASVTNAPFVTIRAVRVNDAGVEMSLPATMGDTLSATDGGHDIQVDVDVQVPEYLDITRVELYVHRDEDDASCPISSSSPRALSTRVACNGVENLNWPDAGIALRRNISLGAGNLRTIASKGGINHKRYQINARFRLPRPDGDNWLVAFVYGSKNIFPLTYNKQDPGKPVDPIAPFALTNPIFIDADGDGYDKPPFSPLPPPPESPGTDSPGAQVDAGRHRGERSGPPTEGELIEAWRHMSHAH